MSDPVSAPDSGDDDDTIRYTIRPPPMYRGRRRRPYVRKVRPYAEWIRRCEGWARFAGDATDLVVDCSAGAPPAVMIKLGMLLGDRDVPVAVGRGETLCVPLLSGRPRVAIVPDVYPGIGPGRSAPGVPIMVALIVAYCDDNPLRLTPHQKRCFIPAVDPAVKMVYLIARCCLSPSGDCGWATLAADNVVGATLSVMSAVGSVADACLKDDNVVGLCVASALPEALTLAIGGALRPRAFGKPVCVFDRVGDKFELAFKSGP